MKNIIHWCMPQRRWTSHTYKSCAKADTVLILSGWSTETKPSRRTNPKGWIVTDHTNVVINPNEEQLSRFVKTDRLLYNKLEVSFSHNEGICLLFDSEGCFLLEPKPGGN